ncbi:condensation domain-containing protein, partial [Corallococcus sp. Z5C101001]|uniref:condensation domain-containing protein n=1 Tax=Corallococcus sp. Z5C101001 TaxID=2596829 RepID=UPI001181728C
SIGRPIAGTRVYVLDGALQPVPEGVPGELYIGGEGVTRGYLGRAELTAEKFLPEAYGPEGSRMYRTGDRVRWKGEGRLEYVNRADTQVKVRGYRIELGEIEAVLRQQEEVRDAAVVVRGEGAEARLVGYVVAKAGEVVEGGALRERLREKLPEYMVPPVVKVLEAMPLTPNGKVDRKALPEVEAGAVASREYEAPRNKVEGALASIWAEVLRVPRVGVKDSFFELGGHSLMAMRVVSRVREELGVELPLRALFEATTVEALAARLGSGGKESAPALTRVSRELPLALSFAQQRLWFLDRLEPGSPVYNVAVAVRLEGVLDVGVLKRALREVMRRHESLRTTFAEGPSGPVQSIHSRVELLLEQRDVTAEPSEAREANASRLLEREAQRPFDLIRGPLIRAMLVKSGETDHLMMVVMHHIVADGWSLDALVGEMAVLYGAFVQGRPSPLPELPIQYADYAVWQRDWLQGGMQVRQLGYWREQLRGAPPALELMTDMPRPAVRGLQGARQAIHWPKPLAEALKSLGQLEGASLFMVLLAGWQTVLARYSGQDDVSVGSPMAGRTRSELEGLIGVFVNTLVLRA